MIASVAMASIQTKTNAHKLGIVLVFLISASIIMLPFTMNVAFSAYTPFCFFSGSIVALSGLALRSKMVVSLGFSIALWTIISPFFFLMSTMI